MTENRQRLRAVLVGRLESLERAGVQQLPKARPRVAARIAEETEEVEQAEDDVAVEVRQPVEVANQLDREEAVAKSTARARSGGALFEDDKGKESPVPASTAATLAVLQQEVAPCTRCGELASTRTQTVFGVGNPQARLCFLGEAPGADEDRLGEPFVGRGGQLLNKIIEACRLKREEVYILNMLKCRPPGNRNPLPDELVNCRPYLDRQLELIEPEFICCLGAVASQNLLGTTTPIGKLRGKFHAYRGAKVVCTFHPAYLLRNPAAKKDCWDDMKFLMREMGVEL
jgi:DNA polymerase